MSQPSVVHSTFVIERRYAVSPDRVFAAFSDPSAKQRWFAGERGMDVEEYHLDFRAGGREYTRYRFKEGSPFPGADMVNETIYQDIVPGRRIVLAYTMAIRGNRFSASLATIELVADGDGTTLVFTDQGAYFEHADGPQMREHGWSKILDKLTAELAR